MTVAVVLATHNGEKYISEQLNSILKQTRLPNNIIISDDHSIDKTIEICESILKQGRCNYIITRAIENGVVNNFFNGISYVKEDIIFFSDQDDVWNCEKIEKMLNLFEKNKNCMEVLSDCYIWDGKNTPNSTMKKKYGNEFPQICKGVFNKDSFWKICIKKNIATGMSMAFRKSVLKKDDYKPEYILHDDYINIVCAVAGEVMYIEEPLALYRQHDNNTIGADIRISRETITKMKNHTYTAIYKNFERTKIISELNNKANFLNYENKNELESNFEINYKRISCMKKRDIAGIFKIVISNYHQYPNFLFAVRDILVCLIR